jgi:U3 small nucleolar RNA-associated protein 21
MLVSPSISGLGLRSFSVSDEEFFRVLIDLPPSSLDLEIRSIPESSLQRFLDAFTVRLTTAKDFEALQSILSVFLSAHRDAIVQAEEPGLREALERLLQAQEHEAGRLNALVGFGLGTLSFVRGLPVL